MQNNGTATYTVYAHKLDEVMKDLNKLAKKANRYGVPFSIEVGEEYPKNITVYKVDPVTQRAAEVANYDVSAVDITVTMDLVKQNGWEVLARVERVPGTELRSVATYGSAAFQPEWEHSDMHCDHCGTGHYRNTVYVVRDSKGNTRQVGKSCLKDYTGISPASLIGWAEVADIFQTWKDGIADDDFFGSFPAGYRWYCVDRVLALAMESISRKGYVKSGEPNSTKESVVKALANEAHPSKETLAEAAKIREWLMTEEGQREISFMELGTMAILQSGMMKASYIGYACYWPVVYSRYMERLAREKARATSEAGSDYVAEVGKRVTLEIVDAKVITSWDTEFGTTYVWKMHDSKGNVLTWKTSKGVKVGTLTGTVKAHTEYRGVRQTELTRCRMAG